MMASGRRSWISGGVAGGGGGRDDSAKGGVDVLEATSIFLSVMMSSSLARLRTSNTSKSFDTNHGDSIPPLDQCPFAGPGHQTTTFSKAMKGSMGFGHEWILVI